MLHSEHSLGLRSSELNLARRVHLRTSVASGLCQLGRVVRVTFFRVTVFAWLLFSMETMSLLPVRDSLLSGAGSGVLSGEGPGVLSGGPSIPAPVY